MFDRPRIRHPRLAFLVALLALSLVLAAVLAYEAQDAARSHRATAVRALQDYASIAAFDYSVYLKEHIYDVLTTTFAPLHKVNVDTPGKLPSPAILHPMAKKAAQCETAAADSGRYYFRLDLRDGSFTTSGSVPGPEVLAWVRDSVGRHAREVYGRDWLYAHIFGEVGGKQRVIVYSLKQDSAGNAAVAYGMESCMCAWGVSIFKKITQHYALLPDMVTGGHPNDSLFSVAVTDTAGRVLYRSAMSYPDDFSSTYPLLGMYGGLVSRVSINPEAAGRLVIGGLPRSRLPLLLGLLAITTGLVVAALLVLRREYELARLRANFIANVSHELRTPLAQIRMFAETLLLGRTRSDEERRRSLEIIDQEARRLTHLVGNVLEFSRTERRAHRLSLEPTLLSPKVREVIEAFAPLASARRMQVRAELEEGVVAAVDRNAFCQMLLNLLDNAVKYGPVGQTVTITLSAIVAGTECRARLAVSDQGPGIEAKERERIWEPFYRLERESRSAIAGSGIGLSVVRELLALHGGRGWVEPAAGGGSRFVIELPAIRLGDGAPLAGDRQPRDEPARLASPAPPWVQGNGDAPQ